MGRRFSEVWRAVAALTIVGAMAANAGRDPVAAQPGARVGQPAPEIAGGPWLNSEPLSLAGLRGRVVFVEFWTYG
jgi:hypothetical protein